MLRPKYQNQVGLLTTLAVINSPMCTVPWSKSEKMQYNCSNSSLHGGTEKMPYVVVVTRMMSQS